VPVWVRATLGVGQPQTALPQALLPLASWQVGPNLIPWVHLAWHARSYGLWALFVSVTQDWIICAFLLHSLAFSLAFRLWVPADHDSPKLVELD